MQPNHQSTGRPTLDTLCDEALLRRWIAGERAAGEALFRRYLASLYAFLRSRVRNGVDDLMQQVLLCCVEGRHRITGDSFGAYLLGVARRQVHGYYRSAARRGAAEAKLAELGPKESRVTPMPTWAGSSGELVSAVQELPHAQRQVLQLMYWGDMTGPEVAAALGLPINTVYTRLRRSRLRLAEALAEQDGPADDSDCLGPPARRLTVRRTT